MISYSKALALEYLALAEASYSLALAGNCELPAGYLEAEPILMRVNLRPILLKFDIMQVWGFLTLDPAGNPIVVFRGTQDLCEWGEDAYCLPMSQMNGFWVHKGFKEVYDAMRDSLTAAVAVARQTGKPITFIGHSLGAALATLAFLEFGGKLFTFAGPRVTDIIGAMELWAGQNCVRVINVPDVVPDVPLDQQPIWSFRHGGIEVRVDGPGSYYDRKVAHALESYRIGIEKTA